VAGTVEQQTPLSLWVLVCFLLVARVSPPLTQLAILACFLILSLLVLPFLLNTWQILLGPTVRATAIGHATLASRRRDAVRLAAVTAVGTVDTMALLVVV